MVIKVKFEVYCQEFTCLVEKNLFYPQTRGFINQTYSFIFKPKPHQERTIPDRQDGIIEGFDEHFCASDKNTYVFCIKLV
jgi:hypothetical protein